MSHGLETAWAPPPHLHPQPHHLQNHGRHVPYHGLSHLHGRMCESPEPCEQTIDSSDNSSMRPLGHNFTPAVTPDRRSSPGQSPEKVTTFGRLSLDDSDTLALQRQNSPQHSNLTHARHPSGSHKRPANCEPNIGGVPQPNAKAVRCNPAVRSRAKPSLQHRRTASSPLARQHALKSIASTPALSALRSPTFAEIQRQAKLREDSGYYTANQSRSSTLQQDQQNATSQQPAPTIVPTRDPASDQPWYFPPFTEAKPRQAYLRNVGLKRYLASGLLSCISTPPVSQAQLCSEVRAIFTGLVVVERKCIEIDTGQAREIARARQGLPVVEQRSPENWRAWTALHKTLLFEHHDFLLSSQHPAASPSLKNLAIKWQIPMRLWKHAIHAYLEILRYRRPESKEYMSGFIDTAYQVITLLYDTVPTFTDTWVECLGDLARYRMAVEENKETHAHWAAIAARWYSLAASRRPLVGRLSHHLGILERPSMKKFFYYAKSLTCVTPFTNARDSLTAVCVPIVQDPSLVENSNKSIEACLVTYHAMLFIRPDASMIDYCEATSIRLLAQMPSSRLKDVGAAFAVLNVSFILGLGSVSNPLWKLYNASKVEGGEPASQERQIDPTTPTSMSVIPRKAVHYAQACMMIVCQGSTSPEADPYDALPFVHIMLAFIRSLIQLRAKSYATLCDSIVTPLLRSFGSVWNALSKYLNHLNSRVRWVSAEAISCAAYQKFQQEYPKSQVKEDLERQQKIRAEQSMKRHEILLQPLEPVPTRLYKPLREDHMLRGLVWVQDYFPGDWFDGMEEDESRVFETEKARDMRVERVQGLAAFVAMHSEHLDFDQATQTFSAPPHAQADQPLTIPEFDTGMKPFEHAIGHSPASTATYSANSEDVEDDFTIISPKASTLTGRVPSSITPLKQQGNIPISVVGDGGGMDWTTFGP